jgi:hypothetical protein
VLLDGDVHFVLSFTTDAAGGTHESNLGVYTNVTGTGLVSGDTYHVVLANPSASFQTESGTLTATTITATVVATSGPNNNLSVHGTGHFTVTPSGQDSGVINDFGGCK